MRQISIYDLHLNKETSALGEQKKDTTLEQIYFLVPTQQLSLVDN